MQINNTNQAALVKQLQHGSETAFTDLYDLYCRPLYRNVLRLCKDEDVAEEILQDLFLKIWEKRETLNSELSFKSYLYKVGENLVYTHFRKIAKDKRLVEHLISSSLVFSDNVEEKIIQKEYEVVLKKAIEKLPLKRKQVYAMCKLDGKSYEEVSIELGISAATIRDHIVKANKAVKQYLITNQNVILLIMASDIFMHTKNL